MSGNKGVAPTPDQVRPAGLFKGPAHLKVILRLEELQQRSLKLAIAQVVGDVDRFLREGIDAGVVHAVAMSNGAGMKSWTWSGR